MTANELRIGNWVTAGVVPIRIESIHQQTMPDGKSGEKGWHVYVSGFIQLDNHYCFNSYNIQPIPLTTDILEKAGFVKTGRYAIGAGGYITYKNGTVELMQPKKGNPFSIPFHPAQITSLHQLQNLYFSLTGTELNIQL
jgi:hypothetical protein